MVYINTTGKHNEVWLDKPYATITVECPDCPSTEDAYNSGWTDGSEDGYHKGYQSGRTDGYDDGWGPGYDSGYTDGLEACSGGSCEGIWEDGYDSGYTDAWQPAYDSGYTDGLNACSGGSCEGIWEAGYLSGVTDQKNKLASTAITQNGTYTRPDGWSSVTINVSGYSQADLDAAFASGYSAGLRECSGYTPTSGVSVLDFVYETSAANQTIRLFTGEAQNDNAYFYEFYSALTRMDIDGVQVQKSENNIYRTYPRSADWYFYTFPTAGRHIVKFYLSREYNAGWTLDKLIFAYSPGYDGSHPEYPDAMPPCPIVEANIGETYEWLSLGVFQNAYELTAVTLPNSLKWVGPYSFEYSGIKEITIPDSVTQIRYESFYGTDGLFNSCSALTSATIGSGITDLKNYTFNNCTGLETVIMKPTTPPVIGNNTFSGCSSLAHIYVPASAVEDYKAATNWSNYASIISAIQ